MLKCRLVWEWVEATKEVTKNVIVLLKWWTHGKFAYHVIRLSSCDDSAMVSSQSVCTSDFKMLDNSSVYDIEFEVKMWIKLTSTMSLNSRYRGQIKHWIEVLALLVNYFKCDVFSQVLVLCWSKQQKHYRYLGQWFN